VTHYGEPVPRKPSSLLGAVAPLALLACTAVAVAAASEADWSRSLVYGLLTLILAFWLFELRRQARRWTTEERVRQGLCPRCGYDLRGHSDRCPECGRPVPYSIRAGRAKSQ